MTAAASRGPGPVEGAVAAPGGGPATFRFDTYREVREALFCRDLSRTFDRRSFAEGNIRDGVVSVSHGELHRARRRLENALFRPDLLHQYERELFPPVLDGLLDALARDGRADLVQVGNLVSAVLAARRIGVDLEPDDLDRLVRFDQVVDGLAQMSSILDSRDPDRTRQIAREALAAFEAEFVRSSWERRERLLDRHGPDSAEVPVDLLTVLLRHRHDPSLQVDDDGRIIRELATYIVGGVTPSSLVFVNAIDLLLPRLEADPALAARIAVDRQFVQRCLHEAIRLRPTTPEPKRHAEADARVGGRPIPAGSVVVLDLVKANVDPDVFGPTAGEFDPDRTVPTGVARWGLSFGAGPHQCPGRSVAAGFPVPDGPADDEHLFGLNTLMVQDVVARGVRRDPSHPPTRETRTERYTWWTTYPVLLGQGPAGGPGARPG